MLAVYHSSIIKRGYVPRLSALINCDIVLGFFLLSYYFWLYFVTIHKPNIKFKLSQSLSFFHILAERVAARILSCCS